MPRLKYAWIWPATGKAHKPWDDEPELDSFVRTSRRVSEAFRASLAQERIEVRDGTIELYLDGDLADETIIVRVDEHGVTDGCESGSISVSRGFHTLDAYTRAFFVADAIHAATRRLGEVHGWDVEAIDRAMDRVRAEDYNFEWTSGWHASVDGASHVRLNARLDDDGFARVRFEFAEAPGAQPRLTTTEIAIGTRLRDLRRLADRIAWDGGFAISTRLKKRTIVVDATTGEVSNSAPIAPRPNDALIDPDLPLPHILVEEAPPIAFTIGGGPMNKVPKPYSEELDRLFGVLATDLEWVTWWMHAGVPVIELEYDFEAKAVRTDVVVAGDVLSATIARPRKTIVAGAEGIDLARADVVALLDDVCLRIGLVPPPPLPL